MEESLDTTAFSPLQEITPFEKNVEIWRQLWRVCERCEIILQVVDARNPLLFYCKDLVKYVEEVLFNFR